MDDNEISEDLAEQLNITDEMPEVTVEPGQEEASTVKPQSPHGPTPVRERLHAGLVDNWPDLQKYDQYADRPFPPIRLDPPR